MDQVVGLGRCALADGLVQGIEDEASAHEIARRIQPVCVIKGRKI